MQFKSMIFATREEVERDVIDAQCEAARYFAYARQERLNAERGCQKDLSLDLAALYQKKAAAYAKRARSGLWRLIAAKR